ncbi:MAG: hypothetical protein IPL39_04570 [Opitutaceae bacterium]|nr:hypothetical protein [Opitutaceae bacterium]
MNRLLSSSLSIMGRVFVALLACGILPATPIHAGIPLGPTPADAALPIAVDNSKLPFFPPLRYKGYLESANAFAATYFQMTHEVARSRRWTAAQTAEGVLSPKWTYNFANQGRDSGVAIADVYRILMQHGAASWAAFPYNGSTPSDPVSYTEWCTAFPVWQDALQYRTDLVGAVSFGASDTPTPIKGPASAGLLPMKRLLQQGHVLLAQTRLGTTINGFLLFSTETDRLRPCLIVGYDDTKWYDVNSNGLKEPSELGAFKVLRLDNYDYDPSGDDYIWIAYDALNKVPSGATYAPFMIGALNPPNRTFAFDGRCAYWINARSASKPKLLAWVTLEPTSRAAELSFGVSSTGETSPTMSWRPVVPNMDETDKTLGNTGTNHNLVFDLTDLADNSQVIDGTAKRWYVSGKSGAIRTFGLIAPETGMMIADYSSASFNPHRSGTGNTTTYSVDATPVPGTATAQKTWSIGPALPTARTGTEYVSSGGTIYGYGGTTTPIGNGATVITFDPGSGTWKSHPSSEQVSAYMKMVSLDGQNFRLGGEYSATVNALSAVPSSGWTNCASLLQQREGMGAAALTGRLYVFGGAITKGIKPTTYQPDRKAVSKSMEIYDPAADKWAASAAALQVARYLPATAVAQGKIYAIGGHASANTNDWLISDELIDSVEEFDPARGTWRIVTRLPVPFEVIGAATVGDDIYVLAALTDYTIAEAQPVLWKYSPATGAWSHEATLPTARYDLGMVALGSKLYFLGGTAAGNHACDVVEVFDTAVASIPVPALLPRGVIDAPAASQNPISGTTTVMGWFLDPRGVSKLEVLVDGVILGQATTGIARPDVFNAYPGYANCYSGFTFGLSTTQLKDGAHTLLVRATTPTGVQTTVGSRTFSTKLPPLGSLDYPFGPEVDAITTVSGWFLNSGGVDKIEVLLDSKVVGTATYGLGRADVLKSYPGYGNGNAGFRFLLDTATMEARSYTLALRAIAKDGTSTTFAQRTISHTTPPTARGNLETPKAGTVDGTINATGWFLAPSGVSKIEVLINGEVAHEAIVSNATWGLPRADVLSAYPGYKDANGGFRFQLETKWLRDVRYSLSIRATAKDGTQTTFGQRELKPLRPLRFGIEAPDFSKIPTGTVVFKGWVLNRFPPTYEVYAMLDGNRIDGFQIRIPRPDIDTTYPEYKNPNAGFSLSLDTRQLSNGHHVIYFYEINSMAQRSFIGFNTFTVNN